MLMLYIIWLLCYFMQFCTWVSGHKDTNCLWYSYHKRCYRCKRYSGTLHHTLPFHPPQTLSAWYSTGSNGSNERPDGHSPGVVPGPDDQHHPQRLWMDVDGVRHGQQVLLHMPRGCPLLQILNEEADLTLQTQSLIKLCPNLGLRKKKMNVGSPYGGYSSASVCFHERKLFWLFLIHEHFIGFMIWPL